MKRSIVVIEMVVRDILRRRAVLGLLCLVPLAFYLARHDLAGQSVRFASLGLAWAISTAALFSGNAGKAIEPRLRLSGFRASVLYSGRFAALLLVGWGVGVAYFVLITLDQGHNLRRPAALALELAITVAIAVPVGLTISALVPRDLEGMLVLAALLGVQLLIDPARPVAKLLPFWSTRELTTYAIDPVDLSYVNKGLGHGLAVAFFLTAVTAALVTARLHQDRHIVRPG